jgi:hypothetical protein
MVDMDSVDWMVVPSRCKGGLKLHGSIPWTELEAFIQGESSRGWCDFTTSGVRKAKTREELGEKIQKNAVLFQTTWQCVTHAPWR